MRIVSLLPSATEIVAALGLGDQLVAVTHECDYPEYVKELPKVTRTLIPHDASSAEIDRLVRDQLKTQKALYTLDEELLLKLQPDAIVTQALCDVCAVAEEEVQTAACKLSCAPTIVNLEPMTLSQVLDSIQQVADSCGVSDRGRAVTASLSQRIDRIVAEGARFANRPRVLFLEWLDPPFSGGHWNPELVRLAGGIEVLGKEGRPSRTLSWEEIAAADPDMIVVACCGFDEARARHDIAQLESLEEWISLRAVSTGSIHVFDGNQYFNRPGPRLVESLELLHNAICPALNSS
jgi:iron complex transport system substrate-binding protein